MRDIDLLFKQAMALNNTARSSDIERRERGPDKSLRASPVACPLRCIILIRYNARAFQ